MIFATNILSENFGQKSLTTASLNSLSDTIKTKDTCVITMAMMKQLKAKPKNKANKIICCHLELLQLGQCMGPARRTKASNYFVIAQLDMDFTLVLSQWAILYSL